jgi:signal transduction histidine kinase
MGVLDLQGARSQVQRVGSSPLQRYKNSAAQSSVPTALVRGDDRLVHYANAAFARFLGLTEPLEGVDLERLSREPERLEALITRVWQSGSTELAPDCAYAGPAGTCFGATIAQPLLEAYELTVLIQVVDTTVLVQSRSEAGQAAAELRLANERLLLASLREHELAEQAASAHREIARLLQRKSVMAEVNTLLSSSLELPETLQRVAALALPDLAQCCVVRLVDGGTPGTIAAVHHDPGLDARFKRNPSELSADPDLAQMFAEVKRDRQPCVRSLLEAGPPEARASSPGPLRAARAHMALAVPLQARGALIGVLTLCRCGDSRGFEALDIEFALDLARRASVAVDNAQLYADAQRAVRLREDILAIVSHDLRNPLGAITMSVQRLLKHCAPDDHESSRGLTLILRSSRHMRRLIEELLDMANIQNGTLALRRAELNLEDCIAEALGMFEASARQKRVQLAHQPLGEVGIIRGDADRLLRAIANLVGNAVKFTHPGGEVTVISERTAEGVRVSVRDTGPGIAEQDRNRLFEQYWKGSGTGRSGMGLGLYIARSVAEAHGGHISLESELGVGSTFTLSIPQ